MSNADEKYGLLGFQRWFFLGERSGMLSHREIHGDVFFRCKCIGDTRDIKVIASAICEKHDVLNTRVVEDSEDLSLKFVKDLEGVEISQFSICGENNTEREVNEIIFNEIKRPFDLTKIAPIRFVSIEVNHEYAIVGAVIHHIAFDRYSISVISQDLREIIENTPFVESFTPKVLKHSFKEYIASKQDLIVDKENSIKEYWRGRITPAVENGLSVLLKNKEKEFSFRTFSLNKSNINLEKFSSKFTDNVVFLSAVSFAIAKQIEYSPIILDCVSSDRSAEEHSEVVGCLLDIFPIVVDFSPNQTYEGLLRTVRRSYLDCLERKPSSFLKMLADIGCPPGVAPHINWMQASTVDVALMNDGNIASTVMRHPFNRPLESTEYCLSPDMKIPFVVSAFGDGSNISGNIWSVFLSSAEIDGLVDHMETFLGNLSEASSSRCFA